ncbi:LamG-like jellyroll fold domain-containing protein [Sorangium sp. So ce1335]|uniref:LamG-like jellyroll fold domain-containing protein n=1 Tax=Sorangium sp. So ce1335 TaxID=3133335 RepID=UPI003F6470B8
MSARLLLVSLQLLVACAPELRLGDLPGAGGAGGAAGGGAGGAAPETAGASTGGGGGGTAGSGAGAGGGGEGGAGTGGAGGAGGAGDIDCTRDASCLTDDGLVARYFLDEAALRIAPTQAEDAADAPVALALTTGPELGFVGDGAGHSGLAWTAAGGDSRASAPIDGTKIQSLLHGSRTGTIEAVLRIAEVSSQGSRIVHIGSGTEPGRFTLRSDRPGQIDFWWNGTNCGGSWDVRIPERAVVHGVLDTTVQEPAEARVRLYVNGVPAPRLKPAGGYCADDARLPGVDATLDLLEGRHFVLGNREIGGRTFSGALYYAALYARALTPAEIERHVAGLLASDDRPGQ